MTVGNGKCNTGNPLKLQIAMSVHLSSNGMFNYEYASSQNLRLYSIFITKRNMFDEYF